VHRREGVGVQALTHRVAKVSAGINRNLPARNMLVQVLALFTDSERHNAQHYRQTLQSDGQMDDIMILIIDHRPTV